MQVETANDIERYLAVGAPAVFSLKENLPNPPRYRTVMRGWQARACLILDTPLDRGLPVPMADGQPCVVRFLTGGMACGFDTTVLERPAKNRPFFRVAWPKRIEVLQVREHERLDVVVPCTVVAEDGAEASGELRDLSAGGCKVQSKRGFPVSSSLFLTFVLPDGSAIERLKVDVRNVAKDRRGNVHGCRFTEDGNEARDDIEFFLSTTERARRARGDHGQVLIIEQDHDRATALRDLLEVRGGAVTIADGVVEGFFRLRMISPRLVAVNYALPELSGPAVCRILKKTPGTEKLPVFIYGGTPSEAEKTSIEAGAQGYLGGDSSPEQLADALMALLTLQRRTSSPP